MKKFSHSPLISYAREPSRATFVFLLHFAFFYFFSSGTNSRHSSGTNSRHSSGTNSSQASGNLPSFRSSALLTQRQQTPYGGAFATSLHCLLQLFFVQLARYSTYTGPADKRLFIPQIILTRMIWAASHMTSQSLSFFIFRSLPTRDQRHSMHRESYLSGLHGIAAVRMIRAVFLVWYLPYSSAMHIFFILHFVCSWPHANAVF